MRLPLLLIAGMLVAGPTLADMPRFDVEAHCKEIASYGGSFSESLNRSCFDMEQAAYDSLKPDWDGLPSAMQLHCEDIARYAGSGSYSLLESCVQQEAKAASAAKTFRY